MFLIKQHEYLINRITFCLTVLKLYSYACMDFITVTNSPVLSFHQRIPSLNNRVHRLPIKVEFCNSKKY